MFLQSFISSSLLSVYAQGYWLQREERGKRKKKIKRKKACSDTNNAPSLLMKSLNSVQVAAAPGGRPWTSLLPRLSLTPNLFSTANPALRHPFFSVSKQLSVCAPPLSMCAIRFLVRVPAQSWHVLPMPTVQKHACQVNLWFLAAHEEVWLFSYKWHRDGHQSKV